MNSLKFHDIIMFIFLNFWWIYLITDHLIFLMWTSLGIGMAIGRTLAQLLLNDYR